MKKEQYLDPFLKKRVVKYDEWLNKGQISFSSKVIPVAESFNAKQWVLPREQVLKILQNAQSVQFKTVNAEPTMQGVIIRWKSVFC